MNLPLKLEGFSFPTPTDPSDQKLLDDVRSYGWHVISIAEDEAGPGFAFTVGLYARTKKPEILLMGVPPDASTRVLNSVGEYLMEGGDLIPNRRYPKFVDRCDVIFRYIARNHYRDYLGYARWFYGTAHANFPAMQCLWPDLEGIFPDDAAFAEKFRRLQPDLSS